MTGAPEDTPTNGRAAKAWLRATLHHPVVGIAGKALVVVLLSLIGYGYGRLEMGRLADLASASRLATMEAVAIENAKDHALIFQQFAEYRRDSNASIIKLTAVETDLAAVRRTQREVLRRLEEFERRGSPALVVRIEDILRRLDRLEVGGRRSDPSGLVLPPLVEPFRAPSPPTKSGAAR